MGSSEDRCAISQLIQLVWEWSAGGARPPVGDGPPVGGPLAEPPVGGDVQECPPIGAWVLAGTPLGVVLLEIICMLLLAGSPVGGVPPELPAAVFCVFFVILFPFWRSAIKCAECWGDGLTAAERVKWL